MTNDTNEFREPFKGRFYTILNVEGDGDPTVLYRSRATADTELARRQALPVDDDDHLSEYHHVFSCDVAGTFWNSDGPDPREGDPLSAAEIAAVHGGEA